MHVNLSIYPEPDVTDEDVAARLATPELRAQAMRELHWRDHHILRKNFRNRHKAGPDMWRTNQPSPEQLAEWAELGVKSIINLRGISTAAYHVLEREACDELGLKLYTFRVASRDAPPPSLPRKAKELFDQIEHPALMHCKSGADRAGLMGALYQHLHMGKPMEEALGQLSFDYLHIRAGKTGILDAYLEHYLATGAADGVALIDWAESVYDQEAFLAAYKANPFGSFLVDRVLRRE